MNTYIYIYIYICIYRERDVYIYKWFPLKHSLSFWQDGVSGPGSPLWEPLS